MEWTINEMKQEFAALYQMMATSNEVAYMHVFGQVHKEMFEWLLQNKPDVAEEMLLKLEAIRWCQYLTPKEADKITAGMDPKAPWSREQWKQAMTSFGLPLEEQPHYNRCALFVEMSKIYSDFGENIAEMLGKSLVPTDKDIIAACYKMALKTLKDKDGIYNIRKYFNV